ncbi:MAG: hypothetical protein ACFFDK_19105 [Promethearchaeota archaeon]
MKHFSTKAMPSFSELIQILNFITLGIITSMIVFIILNISGTDLILPFLIPTAFKICRTSIFPIEKATIWFKSLASSIPYFFLILNTIDHPIEPLSSEAQNAAFLEEFSISL